MKRLFKWVGLTLLGFLFFLALFLGTVYLYKSEIFAAVNQEIKKSIDGDFNIGSIDFAIWEEFPSVSITLRDIYIRGPQHDRYPRDFFNARKVFVNLELGPLLHKALVVRSIRVTQGTVFIFRTRSGYTNTDVFKTRPVQDTLRKENLGSVLFHKVELEDVKFSYQDSLKKKSFGFHFLDVENRITQNDSAGFYALRGDMNFEGLMFNPDNGSFLSNKKAKVRFNLEYRPDSKVFVIHPSVMEFSKSTVDLSGEFYFAAPGKFSLRVGSASLDYPEGISLLTQALQRRLEKFEIEKPVKVTTTLKGRFAPGAQPDVDVAFQIGNSKIKGYKLEAQGVTVDGTFSNHVDPDRVNDDSNSWIKLTSLEGIFQGLPTKLTATISDLKDPAILLESHISTDLRYLNTRLDTQTVRVLGGTFSSHINFSGKLNEYLDSTKTKFRGKLNGTAVVKDGSFNYVPRKHLYENIELSIEFNQDHLMAKEISLKVNKNPVQIKGEGNGFIPFFSQPEKKGYVKLQVYSPHFDFASMVAAKKTSRKATSREKAMTKKKVSVLIDKLYEKIEFDVTVRMDQFSFGQLNGTKMDGRVVLSNQTLEARNFMVSMASGAVGFSFSLANLHKPINPVFLSATVRNADVRKFFYSFNNFGLASPTHENLEGRINLNGKFWGAVDDDFTLWVPSLAGNVEVSVKNGSLRNFEPLQNMSNFLFKRRDFNNVHFGEIKTRFRIRGTEIDISKMEIESTVLRLFVEGRYSLKDSTNLELQVPLSNLKKRDKNYQPENVGIDSRVGPSVFLHVYKDSKGKTVIAYDPFKKHVKKVPKKNAASRKGKSA